MIPRRGSFPSGEEKKQKRATGFCFKQKAAQNPKAASFGGLAAIPHTLETRVKSNRPKKHTKRQESELRWLGGWVEGR